MADDDKDITRQSRRTGLTAEQLHALVPLSPGTVFDHRIMPDRAEAMITERQDGNARHIRYEIMATVPEISPKTREIPRIIEETYVDGVRRQLIHSESEKNKQTYRYDSQGVLLSSENAFLSGVKYFSNFGMVRDASGKEEHWRKKMEIRVDPGMQAMPTFDSSGMITALVVQGDDWQKTYAVTPDGTLPEEGVYAVTRFESGDTIQHGHLGYGYESKFAMRHWADFDAVRVSISEMSVAELARHIPEVNFAGRDLAEETGENRHKAKLACVTTLQETDTGILRTTTFEQQKGQYARHPWFEFEAISDVVPKTIKETLVDGVRREMVIEAGYKTLCTRKYDAAGRLEGGDDAAVVVAHDKGKLLEFYSGGQPHCLHGAWRRGKDLDGKEVEEYAVHGAILDKAAFYALPQVQEACSLKGRFSRWFARATGQGGPADLAAIHGVDISPQERLLKVTALVNSLTPDMRRDVVGHLASSFPDYAPAGFDAWYTNNLSAVYQEDTAARALLEKVSQVDATAADIQQFAARFADQPVVKGVMDTFAAEALLLKENHDVSIARAAALPAERAAYDAQKQEVCAKFAGLFKQGISPLPPGDEMRALMAVVTHDYTALPVPGAAGTSEFTQAAGQIDASLNRISASLHGRTQEISNSLEVVARLLDRDKVQGGLTPIEDHQISTQQPSAVVRPAKPSTV